MKNELDFTCNPQKVFRYADYPRLCVQAVYANLIGIISECTESDGFSVLPDGRDAPLYYRRRVDAIEAIILGIYDKPMLVEFLLSITNAVKQIVCSYGSTNVPKIWHKINPNLRFYSPSFEVMTKSPEFYEKIKSGQSSFSLDYYPGQKELDEYHEYFAEQMRKNEDGNFRYDKNYFFQKELVETVKTLFELIQHDKDLL